MTRKVFWGLGMLALLAALFAWPIFFREAPPSVILISIDTLRGDRLPIYGYNRIETPAIDSLAGDGVVFENAYSHVPLTLPSHASIFTGYLPVHHGVRDNVGFRLGDEHSTLAETLKRAGYSTGGAVSSLVLRHETGIGRGFDWYDDDLERPRWGEPLSEAERSGAETVQRALGWLERQVEGSVGQGAGRSEEPFFLFLHLYEPHTPYKPPRRFWDRYKGNLYDGEVAYSDELVGRFLDGLRRLSLYDGSLILLVSDHGEGLGEHGERDHGVFLYREVLRVPLVVKLPGGRQRGRRWEAPVALVDLFPTILELVGASAGSHGDSPDGISLVPVLRGKRLARERWVYSESYYGRLHFGWKELVALTGARYSYILAPRQELYDIVIDPGQRHNLLASEPASEIEKVREHLRRELEKFGGLADLPAPELLSPEELEVVGALGYAGGVASGGEEVERPDPKERIGDLNLYRQAMGLKKVGRYEQVVEKLREVLRGSPRMPDAWDELALALRRLGRYAEAVEALEQGLEIAPHRVEKLFELCELLVPLGKLDQVRAILKKAAEKRPGEAKVRLALLDLQLGKPDAARQLASEAAPFLPAAIPFIDGVLSYGKKDFSEALTSFEKVADELKKQPGTRIPHFSFYHGDTLLALSFGEDGRLTHGGFAAGAEKLLRQEMRLYPDNGSALAELCALYRAQGRRKELAAILGRFARDNPSPQGRAQVKKLRRAFGQW